MAEIDLIGALLLISFFVLLFILMRLKRIDAEVTMLKRQSDFLMGLQRIRGVNGANLEASLALATRDREKLIAEVLTLRNERCELMRDRGDGHGHP